MITAIGDVGRQQDGAQTCVHGQVVEVRVRGQDHLPSAVRGPAVRPEDVDLLRVVVAEALPVVSLRRQGRLLR